MSTTEKKNLSEAEICETVIVWSSGGLGWRRISKISKIERITKTMIVVEGVNYNRITGRRTGNSRYSALIYLPDPGEIDEIRNDAKKKGLVKNLSDFQFDSLPIETLEMIIELLPKTKP